jgi:branched-chain amino acid transport system permease protein
LTSPAVTAEARGTDLRHGVWDAWRGVLTVGAIAGAVVIYLCVVGIVPVFAERPLIDDVVTLGQVFLTLTGLAAGYFAVSRAPTGTAQGLIAGAIAGIIAGAFLAVLILLSTVVTLRSFLPNISPDLFDILTLESDPYVDGFWMPLAAGLALGLLGAALALLPGLLRGLIIANLAAVIIIGLFAGLVRNPMLSGILASQARTLFASEGLTVAGALLTVAVTSAAYLLWHGLSVRQRIRAMPEDQRRTASIPLSIVLLLFVLWVPLGFGAFVAQAVALIALYILMGLGLNITLGLAGLLDLGFVAFFAVGAYTVALLTSTGPLGLADLSFWFVLPLAIIAAMAFGVLLGLPILGIRGDYLAIATLGFGEIIAILARSDLMKQWLGGPQGITSIPPLLAVGVTDFLAGPVQIYYVSLACAAVIAFVAYRLRGSRLGRAWLAIREDEDVAEALGVNLVQTKTLAYMLGAAFAGLGGAIFAGLIGSVFPSSINILVSINVAAIVIVGGMGSIPGVVLGAIVLIGLPELFREFSEYRFLFYGIVLMVMMRFRPEGLWPSRVGRREMHGAEAPATALPLDATEST